jgi:hypothetical protein
VFLPNGYAGHGYPLSSLSGKGGWRSHHGHAAVGGSGCRSWIGGEHRRTKIRGTKRYVGRHDYTIIRRADPPNYPSDRNTCLRAEIRLYFQTQIPNTSKQRNWRPQFQFLNSRSNSLQPNIVLRIFDLKDWTLQISMVCFLHYNSIGFVARG